MDKLTTKIMASFTTNFPALLQIIAIVLCAVGIFSKKKKVSYICFTLAFALPVLSLLINK